MRKWMILISAVILFDQISKLAAVMNLTLQVPLVVMPYVNLTLIYNDGASFGLLSGAGGWQRWLFIAAAFIVSAYLYVWLKKIHAEDQWTAVGLALIIGGAVGNVIDRLIYGHVIDFIDIYYQVYHWPVFNAADSAIVIGAMILIIAIARERKPQIQ